MNSEIRVTQCENRKSSLSFKRLLFEKKYSYSINAIDEMDIWLAQYFPLECQGLKSDDGDVHPES